MASGEKADLEKVLPTPDLRKGKQPVPLNSQVREQMRRMPSAGSLVEKAVRSELHRRGLRFRVNYKELPGTPDLVFTRAKIAAFIDGCFWHACPIHGTKPKNNREWWDAKLRRNRERDLEKDAALESMGWLVLHYWAHDDIEEIADEIEWVWRDLAKRDDCQCGVLSRPNCPGCSSNSV